jgi:hypothetical protein
VLDFGNYGLRMFRGERGPGKRNTYVLSWRVISLLNSGDFFYLAVDFCWLSSPLTSMT